MTFEQNIRSDLLLAGWVFDPTTAYPWKHPLGAYFVDAYGGYSNWTFEEAICEQLRIERDLPELTRVRKHRDGALKVS